jgi:hypothetical protein
MLSGAGWTWSWSSFRARDPAALGQFFGYSQRFESKIYRLGMVGNLFVQVEADRVGSPNGPAEKVSLAVYEFRDGLRWRERRFTPDMARSVAGRRRAGQARRRLAPYRSGNASANNIHVGGSGTS